MAEKKKKIIKVNKVPLLGTKYLNMDSLRKDWLDHTYCTLAKNKKCPLWTKGNPVVFGTGSLTAKIMFIGGYPEPEDSISGKPFTDIGGHYVDLLIKLFAIEKEEIFKTNILGCKPEAKHTKNDSEYSPPVNVVRNCLQRVYNQIYLVDPILLIAMGKLPAKALLGKAPVQGATGEIFRIELPGRLGPYVKPLLYLPNPLEFYKQNTSLDNSIAHTTTYALQEALKILDTASTLIYHKHIKVKDVCKRPTIWFKS